MNQNFEINNEIKLIFSKDELGYQEVVNDFKNAEFVNIVTYNISQEDKTLITELEKLEDDVNICVITNVPGRWDTYYSTYIRNRAKKNIDKYLYKLNPENFNTEFSTFFNISNHSKIIMTNNIVYIGSGNFSTESKNNFECGIIIKNEETIDYICKVIIPILKEESIEYHGEKLEKFEIIISTEIAKFIPKLEKFHHCFYNIYDDYPLLGTSKELEVYGEGWESFSEDLFNDIYENLNEIEDKISEIYNIEKYKSLIDESIFVDIDKLGKYFYNNFYDFANFNSDDYASSKLGNSGAMEEQIGYLGELFSKEAMEIENNYIEKLEGNVKYFEIESKKLTEKLKIVLKKINKLKKNQNEIDNTK